MSEDRDDSRKTGSSDEALLKEIRENYEYFLDYWKDARDNRAKNMRYLGGDPWDPAERKKRAGRPTISHDELNQYVFQGVNNLRQNKRGIKIDPRGNGANEKTAELRQDIIRTAEYDSQALDSYLRAAQDLYEGGYGFFRVSRDYAIEDPADDDPHAFDQVICFRPIPNPDSVLYDPACKLADWSDAKRVFVLEPMAWDDYRTEWPDAQTKSFTTEGMRTAPQWIGEKQIVVAEYWRVESERRELNRKEKKRRRDKKKVVQYITNGLEILDRIEQPGSEIPIPAMVGLERWEPQENGDVKRRLYGSIDLAREPQMSLAYMVSQEMEEAGMSPKVPVIGYVGQFATDKDTWDDLNKIPKAYAQVDPTPDPMDPTRVLPLPQWRQFVPNFEAYEVAKESCRRAIQAAMGISPLPTAAQRNNEKSGVALDRIESEQTIGFFHFTDGYDRAVRRAGRIADSWIKSVHDSQQDMMLQKADDTTRFVRLNTNEPYLNDKGEQEQHVIGDEQHGVTVSTAPSNRSQREAVSDFLDNLIAQLPKLPVPPPAAAKLLAMAIQMKDLGPKGDQMAEIISPSQQDQSGQLQQMQQQLAQTGAMMQEMQGALQKLQLEKQGKVIDNEYRLQLEKMKIEAQAAAAEISTKSQRLDERIKFVEDLWAQLHGQAHEAGMQAQEQAHTAQQADADRQAAAQQQMQAQQQQQQGEA